MSEDVANADRYLSQALLVGKAWRMTPAKDGRFWIVEIINPDLTTNTARSGPSGVGETALAAAHEAIKAFEAGAFTAEDERAARATQLDVGRELLGHGRRIAD